MTAGIKVNLDGSAAIQVNNADVIGLGTAGQWGIGGASYGTTGQVLTSAGASAAPIWAAPVGFTAGTTMLFVQTSAPTGWTKSTAHDNKALRVVSGTAGSGGSVAFTTAFASQAVSGTNSSTTATNQATTLAESQMPSHTHTPRARTATVNFSDGGVYGMLANFTAGTTATMSTTYNVTSTGGGGSHSHTQDAHSHTFTGTAINLAVQYVDVIIATKD